MSPSPREAVRPLATRLALTERLGPYAAHRWRGAPPATPSLHLEDVSGIPFLVDIAGVEEYQHRARVRAADGDLYATVTPGDETYDRYCRDTLGLGRVERLALASDSTTRLAVAAHCLDDIPFARLVATTRRQGGLTIHPYMAIETVWELAHRLSARAAAPVTVLGPPPPVTWIANDKARFDELVEAVLGPGWTPDTRAATTPRAIAAHLAALARRHATVGLKRTRCASAMGNAVFSAAEVGGDPGGTGPCEALVTAFLARTGWPPGEEVLAVAWEPAVVSPSTQWWIPPDGLAPPRLDGIYEQILEGDRRVFVGSRPAALPARVRDVLVEAAGRVAAGLQALGYVGRCSFDHLVLGDVHDEFTVRFTECNGRWGGTSTPMHLVDRLFTGARGRRPPYRAQDLTMPHLAGTGFDEVLARTGDEVFDAGTGTGRFVFYNVGPLATVGKLDVIAVASTQAAADRALTEELPQRLAG